MSNEAKTTNRRDRAAFPVPGEFCQSGMTLRDYFAAAAIPEVYWDDEDVSRNVAAAERCYMIADAMLAARSK